MTLTQQIVTVSMIVLGTVITRFLPFILFSSEKKTPPLINYLGQVLPPAIFSLLVVYSLKNTDFVTGNHGLPELASCLIVVLIHIWKRQMLFSIAGGTAAYMFLVQIIFKV